MPASVVQVAHSVKEREDRRLEPYQEEMEHAKVPHVWYQLCYLIYFLVWYHFSWLHVAYFWQGGSCAPASTLNTQYLLSILSVGNRSCCCASINRTGLSLHEEETT